MDLAIPTRPVQLDDEPRFYRLWPRLSRETVYRRFHAPLHRIPLETVSRDSRGHRRRKRSPSSGRTGLVAIARSMKPPEFV